MSKIFFKYGSVIVSGVILISLLIASFVSGSIKDFFLGAATGAALISFGQTIGEMKSKKRVEEQDALLTKE